MPPITLDLTISVATLFAVLLGVWKASALVSEAKATREDLELHTKREEDNFKDFRTRFHETSQSIAALHQAAGVQGEKLSHVDRRLGQIDRHQESTDRNVHELGKVVAQGRAGT